MFGSKRREAEARRIQILHDLHVLQHECPPHRRSYVGDMILYATIGKDRLRLPDDYVQKTREFAMRNTDLFTA